MADARLVYLTGGTGFIGGRLVTALLARGYRLRCLVRDRRRAAHLEGAGAELVPGDVLDPGAHRYGLRGADLAIHAAAAYTIGAVDANVLERVNVDGTQTFLDALREAGTARAIYISSTAALGPAEMGDESSRWDGPFPNEYYRTKTRAHQRALAAQAAGLPLVIVCPAAVYGAGDTSANGRYLSDVARGRAPGIVTHPARFSYVHVDDVADGIIAAAERGTPGATYVLSGEPASINEVVERVARLAGRRPPRLRIPPRLGMLLGSLMDPVARVTGWRMPLSRETVATAASGSWVHSHDKATRELGWQPRPLDEGLAATLAWFRSPEGA